jgi:hypothetical protein
MKNKYFMRVQVKTEINIPDAVTSLHTEYLSVLVLPAIFCESEHCTGYQCWRSNSTTWMM